MIGEILVIAFCGWYMWIQYFACQSVNKDYKKKGQSETTFMIGMFLFRTSWAIFLIIFALISIFNGE